MAALGVSPVGGLAFGPPRRDAPRQAPGAKARRAEAAQAEDPPAGPLPRAPAARSGSKEADVAVKVTPRRKTWAFNAARAPAPPPAGRRRRPAAARHLAAPRATRAGENAPPTTDA